ncbi:MAG: cytochrome P460 family protein [Pseudomonadota bacterium]
MNTKTLGLAALAGAAAVVITACASLGTPDPQWADYKTWTKVTEGKVTTGDPTGVLGGVHEGAEGYRDIFVNNTGVDTLMGSAPYNYPIGTVLVKEQYPTEAAWAAQKKPNLTIMVKVADDSSNPMTNWAWSPSYTKAAGASNFCAGCHAVALQNDFVFTNGDFLASQ